MAVDDVRNPGESPGKRDMPMTQRALSDLWDIAQSCDKPRWTISGVKFCCPCHDDQKPSAVARIGVHRIDLHCYAGCEHEDLYAKFAARGFILGRSR